MSEGVTQLLGAIDRGDPKAAEELLPLVYEELRRLAAARMANEKPGQTLQATALVHEAYLRLVGPNDCKNWDGRGHFFAAAAEAMRRVLVDRARRKAARKHGGHLERVDLEEALDLSKPSSDEHLLALNEALDRLQKRDATKADLVKLRYFAGLTGAQAARELGIGVSTADKYWAYAKVWLKAEVIQILSRSG